MIGVVGAGAFGMALSVALAREGRNVQLWARDPGSLQQTRRNEGRLPGVVLPASVTVAADLRDLLPAQALLIALPTQALRGFLASHADTLDGMPMVACCKGLDLATLQGPTALIRAACPHTAAAVLTGPSFAADIARGLPTALTLAGADAALQKLISTRTLRIYRSNDILGAELGGALKNVVAIGAGVVIGAGLGESARAALMTRGYAEMLRLAIALGARPETLAGLSGLGDLVLTCTSEQSRNFRYGQSLGRGVGFDATVTVEGVVTAQAAVARAAQLSIDMPIAAMVNALTDKRINLSLAIETLLSRPLKQE